MPRPGCCLNFQRCTGKTMTKKCPFQNVNSAEIEKPCPKALQWRRLGPQCREHLSFFWATGICSPCLCLRMSPVFASWYSSWKWLTYIVPAPLAARGQAYDLIPLIIRILSGFESNVKKNQIQSRSHSIVMGWGLGCGDSNSLQRLQQR